MKNGKQESLTLSDLSLSDEELKEVKEEFEIDDNFPLGNRIINIRQAYKGKNRLKLKEEDERSVFDKKVQFKEKLRIGQNEEREIMDLQADYKDGNIMEEDIPEDKHNIKVS